MSDAAVKRMLAAYRSAIASLAGGGRGLPALDGGADWPADPPRFGLELSADIPTAEGTRLLRVSARVDAVVWDPTTGCHNALLLVSAVGGAARHAHRLRQRARLAVCGWLLARRFPAEDPAKRQVVLLDLEPQPSPAAADDANSTTSSSGSSNSRSSGGGGGGCGTAGVDDEVITTATTAKVKPLLLELALRPEELETVVQELVLAHLRRRRRAGSGGW